MLSRTNRIARKDFPEILKSRNFFNSPHFTLRVGKADHKTGVAVSVSKKISKSAVVRNTIRRRVYGSLTSHLPTLQQNLYLFIAKSNSEKLKGDKLSEELTELLKTFKRG